MISLKNLSSTRYLAHRSLNRFIVGQLRNKHFKTVLDIGSGRSPYRKFISTDNYICLDVENRSGDPALIIADINNSIPLEDNVSDCVICTEVLEHLKKPQNALSEIFRILKPGGTLLLTTPMTWPLHEEPNDYFRYTKYSLEMFASNVGFKEIKILPSNNFIYTLCQLSVLHMRRPVFWPLVAFMNSLGILSSKWDSKFDLPLGFRLIAVK
jgi:SAM-dependent methyltransferase